VDLEIINVNRSSAICIGHQKIILAINNNHNTNNIIMVNQNPAPISASELLASYRVENERLREEHDAEVEELHETLDDMHHVANDLSAALHAMSAESKHNYAVAQEAVESLFERTEENRRLTDALLEVEHVLRAQELGDISPHPSPLLQGCPKWAAARDATDESDDGFHSGFSTLLDSDEDTFHPRDLQDLPCTLTEPNSRRWPNGSWKGTPGSSYEPLADAMRRRKAEFNDNQPRVATHDAYCESGEWI